MSNSVQHQKPITIIVTDSGLGGLSITADIYEWLSQQHLFRPVEFYFINALPKEGMGYNQMPDESTKIKTFNRVLANIVQKYCPDFIVVACNTLSVLLSKTELYQKNPGIYIDVISPALAPILGFAKNFPNAYLIIFGTNTTIKNDMYKRFLIKNGISADQIVLQSCSTLASEIEKDAGSSTVNELIHQCVHSAFHKVRNPCDILLVVLACTHYGFVFDIFKKYLLQEGSQTIFINPNEYLVTHIIQKMSSEIRLGVTPGQLITFDIISRCEILPSEIRSISELIKQKSPITARRLEHYIKIPNLF
jgi:glutamate racemase